MQWLEQCIYCNHNLYSLSDGMLKCSRCEKKYSPKLVNKIITLIDCFCENESALEVSLRLQLSYSSVFKYYSTFRHLCAENCEDIYGRVRDKSCEYEEYFYLEKNKKNKLGSAFDAHNFLTFNYQGHIYNLIMPTLHRYKQQFVEDNREDIYLSEFNRFKRKSHIINISKSMNDIVRFWEYFEESIRIYNGVTAEYFPLYLKEIEFKFNHSKNEQKKNLQEYYFRS